MAKKQTDKLVVELIPQSRRVKRPVETNLYWYDSDTKQMNVYRGNRLVFDYDPVRKKSVPRAVTDDVFVYQNSWDDIEKFLKQNAPSLDVVDIQSRRSVTIEVDPQDFVDELAAKLRKLDIRFEIHEPDNDRNEDHGGRG
jgi:hypothetical protein